jgi:AcrR family transcriptional regulator
VAPAPDASETRVRTGRPRNPHIDAAVLEATLSVLDDSGYGGLTLEEVARRAGTTKPAIYRRWPSRQHLVLAALRTRLADAEAPETGCTLCDVAECLVLFVAAFRSMPPDVLGPLFADCANDPALQGEFMDTLFEPPRAAVKQTLDRAHARGDLRADVDRDLIVDLIGSLVHYRVLFRHAGTTDDEIEQIVKALMQGIAGDYPALLEHSLRVPNEHHPHLDAR